MLAFTLLLLPLLAAASTTHSSLVGDWLTPDHSVVQIYPCGTAGHLCARVARVGPSGVPHLDLHNPNAGLRDRPLCGLTVGKDFREDGPDRATGGSLYDPKNGKTYSGQLRTEGDRLKLRGYVGIPLFGRSETWYRAAPDAAPMCGQQGS